MAAQRVAAGRRCDLSGTPQSDRKERLKRGLVRASSTSRYRVVEVADWTRSRWCHVCRQDVGSDAVGATGNDLKRTRRRTQVGRAECRRMVVRQDRFRALSRHSLWPRSDASPEDPSTQEIKSKRLKLRSLPPPCGTAGDRATSPKSVSRVTTHARAATSKDSLPCLGPRPIPANLTHRRDDASGEAPAPKPRSLRVHLGVTFAALSSA